MALVGWSIRKAAKAIPLGRMLLVGDLALLAGRHAMRLDVAEYRRLAELLRHGTNLDAGERAELETLVAKLEPRLFLGRAARRVSPVPIPKRLLYGRRGSPARDAARRGP